MSIRTITGTAVLLAVALLAQALRLFVPIPTTVSMFLIGTIVGLAMVMATWRYGTTSGLIIAWVTPVVAFMQGMLPFMPFIPIVGLGSSVFVLLAYVMKGRNSILAAIICALGKAAVLYGGFTILFMGIHIGGPIRTAILFSMGWPQLVTGVLAVLFAALIDRRVG